MGSTRLHDANDAKQMHRRMWLMSCQVTPASCWVVEMRRKYYKHPSVQKQQRRAEPDLASHTTPYSQIWLLGGTLPANSTFSTIVRFLL
jgi:hypothetical protein